MEHQEGDLRCVETSAHAGLPGGWMAMCPEHGPRVLMYDTATGALRTQWMTGNPSSVLAVQALEAASDLVRTMPPFPLVRAMRITAALSGLDERV